MDVEDSDAYKVNPEITEKENTDKMEKTL